MLDNTSSDPRQWWSECGRRVEGEGGGGGAADVLLFSSLMCLFMWIFISDQGCAPPELQDRVVTAGYDINLGKPRETLEQELRFFFLFVFLF